MLVLDLNSREGAGSRAQFPLRCETLCGRRRIVGLSGLQNMVGPTWCSASSRLAWRMTPCESTMAESGSEYLKGDESPSLAVEVQAFWVTFWGGRDPN